MDPLLPLLAAALLGVQDTETKSFHDLITHKYQRKLDVIRIVPVSATTKVLWFDWEKQWWGGMNVVETDGKGNARYWYDLPQPPGGHYLRRVKVVTLAQTKYLEVVDSTHMGNGFVYLYQIKAGVARRVLRARALCNLSVHFDPGIATITYRDLNNDGREDVILEARCVKGQIIDQLEEVVDTYHREFLNRPGGFKERKEKRSGAENLMD